MTVQDLIALLEDLDPESEVQMACQPSYPLAYTVQGVVAGNDIESDEDEDWTPGTGPDDGDETPPVVWLVQGNHTEDPYGVPRGVWR